MGSRETNLVAGRWAAPRLLSDLEAAAASLQSCGRGPATAPTEVPVVGVGRLEVARLWAGEKACSEAGEVGH